MLLHHCCAPLSVRVLFNDLGSRDDGLLDLRVARAAAEVAGHGGVDLLARGMGIAVKQRLGRHDHSGRAVAAFAKVTALLRARQVRALAQHVQKRLLRLHRERAALAVERQVNRVVVFKHDVLSSVQNLLYVPYRPVSAALCAAAGLSLTGERASHILFFARGHIPSRAGATTLEGPFFGMGDSILSTLHKIKRLNYVEFIQLLYIMSQSGYQRFFQRPNGASPLVFLHIKKRHGTAFAAPCPFPFLRKKRAAEVSAARPSPFHFSMR